MRQGPGRRSRGFTLLEILVVLAVIGVVVGMAVLSLGETRARAMENEAERLHGVLRLAIDEAVIRSLPMALAVEPDGYVFLSLSRDEGQRRWAPMTDDRTFDEQTLPDYARLEVIRRAGTGPAPEANDDRQTPDIVIQPSGIVTPFELLLHSDESKARWELIGSRNGEVSLQRHD